MKFHTLTPSTVGRFPATFTPVARFRATFNGAAAQAFALPLASLALMDVASAQAAPTTQVVVFSVDYSSDTVGLLDSFTATPITEGDLLAAQTLVPAIGPLLTPGIVESGGFFAPQGLGLGTHAGCVGHFPGFPCGVEVDAISHGMDRIELSTIPGPATPLVGYGFSVQRRSSGAWWLGSPPDVSTESGCQDDYADVFTSLSLFPGPVAPINGQHTGVVDGNGLVNCAGTSLYPGLGLFETAISPGGLHDNLDALDMDVPDQVFASVTATYFSLDGNIFDPITLIAGSGSAQLNSFQPGDVLLTLPGGIPAVYASAFQLGLDLPPLLPGSDDLDALALWENGVAGYQRSVVPFDWTSGATDMLLFSVRRGSALVGSLDSTFGLPIEPGDILTPTGPLGSAPGIWIAAEALGLATSRGIAGAFGDDLDAFDTLQERPPGMNFCAGDGTGNACPCGNFGTTGRGCGNSANATGAVLWSNGLASISNDTVVLHASGMTPTPPLQFFQGTAPIAGGLPFKDGLYCVGGAVIRFPVKFALNGNCSFGYGIPGDPLVSVAGSASASQTIYYQCIYRDTAAFCTPITQNFTNGYKITWTP